MDERDSNSCSQDGKHELIHYLAAVGSTAVELMSCNREVAGLISLCARLLSSSIFNNVSLNRSLEEV